MAGNQPQAQRGPTDMERKRRDAVEQIAERNRQAHQAAKKQRVAAEERRRRLRGPDAR